MEMKRELTVEEAAVNVVGELEALYQIVYLQTKTIYIYNLYI